jgi:cyclase
LSALPDLSLADYRVLAGRAAYIESRPEAASNAGLVLGSAATLVVDTRLTPSLGSELRALTAAASREGAARVVVVNTHWHGDHWFGNGAFGDVSIVASEWTRDRLRSQWPEQVAVFSGLRPHQAHEFSVVRPVLPNVGIHTPTTLDLGDRVVSVVPTGPAHTPGDVVVIVPDDAVLYAGDVVVNGHWPVMWDADVAGWYAALDLLAALDVEVVVPGHGPAAGPELLDGMRRCFDLLVRLATVDESRWEGLVDASEFSGWLHRERRLAPCVNAVRAQLADGRLADVSTDGMAS